MKRAKVMTIVGTRPEIIKLSRVITELRRQTEHVLVHTGQNYDLTLNDVFFKELNLAPPDHFLAAAGETAAETIAQVIVKSDAILAKVAPDALLVLGDTNSGLCVIPAKRRHIPIFHMEAGNRCFDERVPEEVNRRIIDHVSDINLPYTEHARRYLLSEGIPPETVIKTGSPMDEVIAFYRPQISASGVLAGLQLSPRGYFVVSAHREENVDDPARLGSLLRALNAAVEHFDKSVVFSTHPRTRKRLAQGDLPKPSPRIRFMDPLGFFDYARLQEQSFCVISDSGTLTEEACLLKFPGVMIREAHERPEGMDEGIVVMAGLSQDRVLESVALVTAAVQEGRAFRSVADYQAPDLSQKVHRTIVSYIDYVNRTVWRK